MAGSLTLKEVEALAEEFSATHLDRYTEELRTQNRSLGRKEINDALWGTIGLTAIEVAVLDSPLLQRLRYIRQLGVVHWVYPGAIHTRFEHTLGVLFQVRHLVSALNAQALGLLEGPLIDTTYEQILRLCALLHDTGHAAFSHVSEMAVESLPEGSLIGAQFSRANRLEEKKLSEIFSYYVIRSRSMRVFLETVLHKCGGGIALDADFGRNLDLLVTKLSDAIVGKKIDDRLPLLHEIISGPFDADKLDYFARDARLAGTPSVLDISRLVQKITVRALDSSDLPNEIARNVDKIETKHFLFGIKWSGVAVLDELHLARVLMYAKIYRHPKVIAIEQMLRAVILVLARTVPLERVVRFLYVYPDDALLTLSSDGLRVALELDKAPLSEPNKARLEHAAKILQAVRERRLWVRAFQIQRRYPADPLEGSEEQKLGLIGFREELEHPQKRGDFIKALLPEVQKILSTLNAARTYDLEDLDSSIMIHTSGQTPGGAQIARAYLVPSSGKPMPFREYTVNRTAWADSYLTDQPAGYIFSPPEIADAVYLAVEKLIRIRHGVRLPLSSFEVSKRNPTVIDEGRRVLAAQAYYRGAPTDLKPVPSRLRRADVSAIVEKFAAVRAAYQEPTAGQPNEIVGLSNEDRIHTWLRQFEDDRHVDCALKLLAAFRMLTRADTVSAIQRFIDGNDAFRGAIVVPLGDLKDSGSVQAYFCVDLQGPYISDCMTLEHAVKTGKKLPIIFIDDFVGSGGQVTDVLAAGFGYGDLRKPLGEQRSIFGDDIREYLQAVKVGFVFTAGWDSGIDSVREIAEALKLDATVFRLLDETSIPFAFEGCLTECEPETIESFVARCAEIGGSLLSSTTALSPGTRDIKTSEKIMSRSLGYGNRAMLLATPFNVPTQTLTAIWATGNVDGVAWAPLMTRRKKV